jgi:molybdopterin synthase catalytic subunit
VTEPFVALRSTPLSLDEAVAAVTHPGAGGISLFRGVVRDMNEGRPVTSLEYVAYEPMAIAEMRRIAHEVIAMIPGVRVAVIHRVGHLSLGEAAVVCAASAPHRREAQDACRWLIDAVKARVPIWKREHGPEGAYWVGWQDVRVDGKGDEKHDP